MPGWRDGSFTGPDAFETLYEIYVGECNAREGPMPASQLLAVFDRWDGLHASVEALAGEAIYEVRDIDGDAVEEVLLGRAEVKEHAYVASMRLVSLKGGSLRVIHDFGVAYVYSFADPNSGDRLITMPVIYYTPRGDGETPEFQVDFYRARCNASEGCGLMPRPSAWQYFKSGSLSENEY